MSGNAVGLGNFLRFPGKVAPYGGAFMVPYFLALLLLGIPLMWIEWTIGRHGGGYGHGSSPGMLHRLWKHPVSKYLGILGVLLPAIIGLYYIYIESWSLGYAWQTMTGTYWGQTDHSQMAAFLDGYTGAATADPEGFSLAFSPKAYLFFLITFAINILVFSRGISKGIEIVAKYAMPTLLVLGVILAVRVLTLPSTNLGSVSEGLARIWVVDWSQLRDAKMWVTATGQVFFTLSLGFGMIHTYASYLHKKEDITLNGLATCSTNEFVEVILGGSIVLPAAVVFFGVSQTVGKNTFDLGFITLPVIFQQLPAGRLFGTLWFVLLFLAGLTSSVAMFTPLLTFLQDELQITRKKGVMFVGILTFILAQPAILFLHRGVLDELDVWAGDLLLFLFGTIEVVIFAWIFGMRKGWAEMHLGAELRVPGIFYYIMLFVTPTYALWLLGWWLRTRFWDTFTMVGQPEANVPYLWLGRAIILFGGLFLAWGVWHAWRTNPEFYDEVEEEEAAP
jgi:SNF family Na+-dependent transporter